MKQQLLIESIRTDGGTQSRAEIHQDTVAEYVEAIQAGSKMPPLLVFHDGTDYWLAEGFHRLLAYQRAEKRNVLAEIKQGTKEDAAWASAGANVTHGLRRTNADKRKATEMAIRLRPDLSPEAIGRHCGVSETLATQIKRNLVNGGQVAPPDYRIGVDGKRYPMSLNGGQVAPPDYRIGVDGKRYPMPLNGGQVAPPDYRIGVDGKRYPMPPATPPPTRPSAQPTMPPAPPPVRTPQTPPPQPPPAAKTPARRPGPQTGQADATGHPIPDHLIGLWDRRTEVEDLLAHLSKVRCAVQAAQDAADPLFAELNTSAAMANLNTAYDALKATAPHAVCPWCHGTLSDQCRGCKGRGMIGRFAWGLVPAELKKGRQ